MNDGLQMNEIFRQLKEEVKYDFPMYHLVRGIRKILVEEMATSVFAPGKSLGQVLADHSS